MFFINCREADESRLREVCESFLGPPTGMAEDTSLDKKKLEWDPLVLVSLLTQLSVSYLFISLVFCRANLESFSSSVRHGSLFDLYILLNFICVFVFSTSKSPF